MSSGHGDDDSDSHGGWSDPGSVPGGPSPVRPVLRGPRYQLGARLGEGGMGVVHTARDRALGRDVALKAQKPDRGAEPATRLRLAREAALTSRLDHPGIVTVHDAGELPDGRAFYTMRLVRGRTLAAALDAGPDAPSRRRLVRAVLSAAEAVAAAHDAGIVHRDLKPSNILLGPHGETQVADWGLAVPTPSAADRWADLPPLAEGGAVGTRGYAAPEQEQGAPPDPRHDVYSLGRSLAAVLGEERPPELEAVIARATHAEPARRYADATELAEDLLAWFEGRRVEAHRYTAGELLQRTLRAWRAPLLAGLVGLVGVSAAVLGGWWQTTRSLERALAAEAAAGQALAELRVQEAVRAAVAGSRDQAEALALAVLHHGEHPVARGVFAAFGRAARPALLADHPAPTCAWTAPSPDSTALLCGEAGMPEGRGPLPAKGAGGQLHRYDDGELRWTAAVAADGAAWEGEALLAWSLDGALWVLDPASGEVRERLPPALGDWTTQVGARAIWAAGGSLHRRAATPSGCEGALLVADTHPDGRVAALCESGRLLLTDPAASEVRAIQTEATDDQVGTALAWYGDDAVVIGTLRGRLLLIDVRTGARLSRTETALGALSALATAPDQRMVAASGASGGVALWRADAAALVAEVPAGRPRSFAFSEAGLVVVDDRVRTWRLPLGAPYVVSGDSGFAQVSVAADGHGLVAVGGGGQVLEVDLRGGDVRRRRFGDRVVKAALRDAEGLVVSGMGEPLLARAEGVGFAALPGARPMRRLGRLASGPLLGLDMDDGLYRWPALDAPPDRLLAGHRLADLAVSGDAAVVLDTAGTLTRLDREGVGDSELLPGARSVDLGPSCLAVATLEAVRVDCGHGARWLPGEGDRLLDVALSADEALVAAGTLDGMVRVWRHADGALLGLLPGHTERVVSVTFLPDGGLASASWDNTVRVWDLPALERPLDALAAELAAVGRGGAGRPR